MSAASIKQTFKEADVNGTGLVSQEKCVAFFKECSSWSENDISYFFDAFPADANGSLNYNEFVDWVCTESVEDFAYNRPISKTSMESLTADQKEDAKEKQLMNRGASETRRKSISGEGVSEESIKNFKCPSYPKPDEAKAKIQETVKSNDKMKTLGLDRFGEAEMEELCMAFHERIVSFDEDVIIQDEKGDRLYIVDEGNFDIFVARAGDDGVLGAPAKVANFGPGSLFGELALMYSAPRAATVRCATPTGRLWSLDREPFTMMLRRCGVQMVEQYSGWLTGVEILNKLNKHEIGLLADASESILLDEGEEICLQGDEGDAFYILEDGTCAAFLDTPEGERLVKSYEKQGEYFGELALLTESTRKLTVKATSEASVFKIDKDTFHQQLGPIKERLQAKALDYADLGAFFQSQSNLST